MNPRQSLLHAHHKIALDRLSSSFKTTTHRPQQETQNTPPPPPYSPRQTQTQPLSYPPLPFATSTPQAPAQTYGHRQPDAMFPSPRASATADAANTRGLLDEVGEDEDDYDHFEETDDISGEDEDDVDDMHEIHINASTLISGTGNVVQSDASGLGARIAAHLVALLRNYDTAPGPATATATVHPVPAPATSSVASATRPETATAAEGTEARRESGEAAKAKEEQQQQQQQQQRRNHNGGNISSSGNVGGRGGRPVRIMLDVSTKVGGQRNVLGGLGTKMRLAASGGDGGTNPAAATTTAAGVAATSSSSSASSSSPAKPSGPGVEGFQSTTGGSNQQEKKQQPEEVPASKVAGFDDVATAAERSTVEAGARKAKRSAADAADAEEEQGEETKTSKKKAKRS